MPGCAAPTDVSGVEERRNQNPRILDDLLGFMKRQLNRDVGPSADSPEQTLFGPTGKQLRCLGSGDRQRRLDVRDAQYVSRRIEDGSESGLTGLAGCVSHAISEMRFIRYFGNSRYCTDLDNYS